MPFPNFHAARIRQPGLFVRIREIRQAEDGAIRFIGGPLKSTGSVAVQAVRFAKDKYTPGQARAWLKEHEEFKSPISFEEASKEDSADDLPFIGEGEVLRFDRSSIANVGRADDGSIVGEAIITRAGVFKYRGPDGSTRRELRPPGEVFRGDSLGSAKMLPITDDHPSEFVSPANAKKLAVGFTGENVRQDGNHVVAPIKINTAEGIAAVDGGRRQLSLGYKCSVEEESGRFDGEDYTHVQRGITYNHLALVDRARAGNVATLRLDAADAVMADVEDTKKEGRKMTAKVRLDSGLEYDCAPEVKVALDQVTKDRTDAVTERDELKKKLDAVTAERDEFKARAEKAEKVDHSEAISKGITARMDVLGKARKVLDEEQQKKLDSMKDEEIRQAVIKAKYPDLDLEGKSAEYVDARFDAIVEKLEDDDGTAQQNADKVIGDAGKKKKTDGDPQADQKREDALEKMKARSRGEAQEKKDK
jgi:hypothetical protein